MVNYSNSIIYKLCCNDTDVKEIYIGSTTSFRARKSGHKTSCGNPNDRTHTYPVYKFIRENGGWENWCMIQIEQYNAQDKRDLLSKERYWIEQLKPALNKDIPGRTPQEYYQDIKHTMRKEYKRLNQEKISQMNKNYREKNQDAIKAKKNAQHNCECGGVYTHANRGQHIRTNKHQFWQTTYNFIHS